MVHACMRGAERGSEYLLVHAYASPAGGARVRPRRRIEYVFIWQLSLGTRVGGLLAQI